MSSTLFTPFRMAGLDLANRIVVSPMCQYSGDDGCANDWHLMHLGMMAHSGAALVIVEATHVERHGRITHGCLGLYSDDNEADLARVVNQRGGQRSALLHWPVLLRKARQRRRHRLALGAGDEQACQSAEYRLGTSR